MGKPVIKWTALAVALALVVTLFAVPTAAAISISKIALTGYHQPVNGEKAVANITAVSIQCVVSEAGWYDYTAQKVVESTATFKKDHEYYLFVKLRAVIGNEITDKTAITLTDEYGNKVETRLQAKEEGVEERIVITKTHRAASIIEEAVVTGFSEPVIGGKPDTALNLPGKSQFTVAKAVWHDLTTDADLTAKSTFEADHEYVFTVQLAPADGYVFAETSKIVVKDGTGRVVASAKAKFVGSTNKVTISTLGVRAGTKMTTASRSTVTTTTTTTPRQQTSAKSTQSTTGETIRTIGETTKPSVKRRLANLWWLWLLVVVLLACAGGAIALLLLNEQAGKKARQKNRKR